MAREDKTQPDAGTSDAAKPDSTGPNARPRNETIAQTGAGIPDDSSHQVEIDEDEAQAIEKQIRSI